MMLAAATVHADGSVEAGAKKSVTCAACHGQDGNSANPQWPSLAGQHAKYTVRALKAYKNGTRQNVLMSGQAMALSEQDMEDLAAYYAAQDPVRREADPELADLGERLYRGGNREQGISACIACHGPTGRGNPAAGWPSVAGQHATYSANALRAYASRERKSDPQQMMRTTAGMLSDEQIAAVASYMQGLR